jgi:predicted HicB family RNase H-like nuclease
MVEDSVKIVTSISRETHSQLQKMAKDQELPLATLVRTLIKKAIKAGL